MYLPLLFSPRFWAAVGMSVLIVAAMYTLTLEELETI